MPGSIRGNRERLPEFYRRPSVNGRLIEPTVHDAFEKLWPWFWNHVGNELGDPTRAGDLADEIASRISKHISKNPGQVQSLIALCRVAAENFVKSVKASVIANKQIICGGSQWESEEPTVLKTHKLLISVTRQLGQTRQIRHSGQC